MFRRMPKTIIKTNDAQVLCNAVVDLISRIQRPYLWKVTVTGAPPHAVTKIYEISATTDNIAAMRGIEIFVEQMSRPLHLVLQ
jgi:hypothetical protein